MCVFVFGEDEGEFVVFSIFVLIIDYNNWVGFGWAYIFLAALSCFPTEIPCSWHHCTISHSVTLSWNSTIHPFTVLPHGDSMHLTPLHDISLSHIILEQDDPLPYTILATPSTDQISDNFQYFERGKKREKSILV